MAFLYPNPILQMKHSFWRVNLHVIYRSGHRSRCKSCVQRWSFLADWRRLMLEKGFSQSFWCTRDTWSFFVPNSVCFWRKGKCFTLLSQLGTFFFQAVIIFATNFCELVHRKTFALPTDCCFWKKDLKIKVERRRNHWRQKRVVFQKSFWTSLRKTRKFRRYYILSLCGQWNQSEEFPNQLVLSGSKVPPLKRNIKDHQRICFLFVDSLDWANWKFFFLWKKCFVSHLFFLAFERTLLIVLLQVRRMKVKATMRQISFGQKNKGKCKKLQHGWVSECWLWYDTGWALKVIVNDTKVLRTSPDT